MRKEPIIVLLMLAVFSGNAQESISLELDAYYERILIGHPVAKRAVAIREMGKNKLREARGNFDPKLISEFDAKQFEDKRYYDIWNSYLKIPTRLNVDFKAGYERNSGVFLNPENNVPSDGLYYAGVTVPLGKGLIVNERNVALKKGKITQREMELEALNVLNNFFLDANDAYWKWFESYQKLRQIESGLNLINIRFEGIRQAAIAGENASIDSVEALIQVQKWNNMKAKAVFELESSVLLVHNFLWSDSLDLQQLHPTSFEQARVEDLAHFVDYAYSKHPDLRMLDAKGEKYKLDIRLSRESLKPTIDVSYNLLLSEQNRTEQHRFLSNNYKAGFHFSYPLLIRKERAKLKLSNWKARELTFKKDQKKREIATKVNRYYLKLDRLEEMIRTQEQIVDNYHLLFDGEQIKFENGESSVFLVNSRENKKLDAQMKLINLKAEYGKALGLLKWASGMFTESETSLETLAYKRVK